MESQDTSLFHLLARYAYLEELVEGGRVLVLGTADAALADHLDRLGVRKALIVDPSEERVDAARAAMSARAVDLESWPLHELDVRQGSYDLVVIEDISAAPQRAEVLDAARAALSRRGMLVASAPNADAAPGLAGAPGGEDPLGYYEFYGQLAAAFPYVRLVGQCPLVGYALADLSSEDPEPPMTFDASLLPEGSEDAEFFVAFCSEEPFEPDPFAVVQVPLELVSLGGGGGGASAGAPHELHQARERVTELTQLEGERKSQIDLAQGEIRSLKLELDRRAVKMAELENERNDSKERATIEHNRTVETKLALQAEKKRHLTLEKEIEMARGFGKIADADRERLETLQQKVAELEPHVKELGAQLAEATRESESRGERAQRLEGFLDEERQKNKELAGKVADLESSAKGDALAEPQQTDEAVPHARITELEEELARERQARGGLERALDETKKAAAGAEAGLSRARQLEGELEELRAALEAARSEASAKAARDEGARESGSAELAAATRRVRELEGELESLRGARETTEAKRRRTARPKPGGPSEALTAELDAAKGRVRQLEGELEELRAALEVAQRKGRATPAPAPAGDGAAREALTVELAEARQARARAEAVLAEADDRQGEDVARLEAALKERGREVARLEAELGRQSELLRQAVDDLAATAGAEAFAPARSEQAGADRSALEERLEELSREAKAHEAALVERDQEITRLEGDLQGLRWKVEELQTAAAPSKESPRQGELETALAAATEGNVELERKLAAASERSAQLMGDLAQAQTSASLAQGELEDATEQASSASLEAAELRACLEQAEQRLASGGDGRQEGDDRVEGLEKQLSEVGMALTAERAERVRLEGALEVSRQRIEELEEQVAESERGAAPSAPAPAVVDDAEAATLRGRITYQEQEIARLEGLALGQSFKLGDLEASWARAEAKLGELGFVEERVAEFTERMELAEQECQRLRGEPAPAAPAAQAEAPELAAIRAEAAALRADLDARSVEANTLEVASKALRAVAMAVEPVETEPPSCPDASELERQANDLEARVKDLKEEKRAAEEALDRVVDGLSTARGSTDALTDVLGAKEEEVLQLEEELRVEREHVQELEEQLSACVRGGPAADESDLEGDDEEHFRFDLVRQLDAARRVVSALEADKRRLAGELERREGDGKEVEAGLRGLRGEILALTEKTEGLRKARKELSDRAASLEEGLFARGERVAELEKLLEAERARTADLQKRVEGSEG